MGRVIQASHLFQREPTPTERRSEFWEWGRVYVDEGILNLDAIVDDMKNATNEAEFKAACAELVEEVGRFPDLNE